MDKLPMCRICLVENVCMYVVVNKNLHELYEKLTGVPFVTEDRRPILACSFCCAKLKQCFRFMKKCLEAEELFAQMMDEDYEPNSSMNIDHLEFCSGFSTRQIELISIVDGCQTENIAVKEELQAVCERQDDIIEPKEEYLSDDQEPENLENKGIGKGNMLPRLIFESDSDGDVPLLEFKTEVEEEQVVSQKKRRADETNSTRASVTKKPKLDTQRSKQEDTVTAELEENEQSNLKDICTTQNRTSNRDTYFNKPDKCDEHGLKQVKHLKQLTQTGISEKHHICGICQHSFSTNYNLKIHIRIHTGEKPYKCDICQRSFAQKQSLTIHIRIHTNVKPFKCDVCQRSFRDICGLNAHIRTHTGEKPYKCDVCQRSFSQNSQLNSHILIHTGEKPFECDVCQRRFRTKNILKSHNLTHTGEKPFKCDICQRSFSQKQNLTTHIRTHTGEKPFKCDLCQRSFRDKSSLNRHIRTHTGEKPYSCNVCQRRFIQKQHFISHSKTHR